MAKTMDVEKLKAMLRIKEVLGLLKSKPLLYEISMVKRKKTRLVIIQGGVK